MIAARNGASPADRRPLIWLARSGYAARGIVYVIIGWLALAAGIGGGGQTTDSKGALQTILGQPFGKILLGIIAVGLLGYVAWRAIQAIRDTDRHGSDAKGLAVRGGLAVSAVTYSLLAIFAISLIFGLGGSSDGGTQDWTAWLLHQPFGPWLVGLIGLAVIGAGLALIWKGWRARFDRHLDWDADTRRIGSPICRFGLVARGVVFLIIGAFLLVAAWNADPSEAGGLSHALRALERQPYGWLLLGITAAGLIAFGLYSLIEAAYRRIEPAG